MPNIELRTATITLVLLFIFLLFFLYSCPTYIPKYHTQSTRDSVQYWKDLYGKSVASVRTTEYELGEKNYRVAYLLDSIARVRYTIPKKIRELVYVTVEGKTRFRDTGSFQIRYDTVGGGLLTTSYSKTFKSPWYTAEVSLGDTSYLNLQSRDTITGIWKEVSTGGLFNRKQYLQFDLSFADTSRRVTGLTTYRKYIVPKQWGINLEARTLLLNRDLHLLGGVGVEKNVGRLRTSASVGKQLNQYTTTAGTSFQKLPWYGELKVEFQLIRL